MLYSWGHYLVHNYIGLILATFLKIHSKLKSSILWPKCQKTFMLLAEFFLRDSSHVSIFQNLTDELIIVILSFFVAKKERQKPAFRVRTLL